MTPSDLEFLRCSECGGRLAVHEQVPPDLTAGTIECRTCRTAFPVVHGIPRFAGVPSAASSYEVMFEQYGNIQLDSVNGTTIASSRLARLMPFLLPSSGLKYVLHAGCGSGRYTEPALKAGVDLWAIDLSAAGIDACRRNLDAASNLHLAQADICRLPFPPECFDVIYSIGVLMAMPSPRDALRQLAKHLKPGGWIVVDIYERRVRHWFDLRLMMRPITKRLPGDWLWNACTRGVAVLRPVSRVLGLVPGVGRWLRQVVPICAYDGMLPLDEAGLHAYSVMDTFDLLGARYAQHVRSGQFRSWLTQAGFTDVEIVQRGMLTARARKLGGAAASGAGPAANQ